MLFFEEITNWIDEGSPVDIIYLDFQNTFDNVPHQRLLLKLKVHGIGDDIIDWTEKSLTNRKQRVVVGRFQTGNPFWGNIRINIRTFIILNTYQ